MKDVNITLHLSSKSKGWSKCESGLITNYINIHPLRALCPNDSSVLDDFSQVQQVIIQKRRDRPLHKPINMAHRKCTLINFQTSLISMTKPEVNITNALIIVIVHEMAVFISSVRSIAVIVCGKKGHQKDWVYPSIYLFLTLFER